MPQPPSRAAFQTLALALAIFGMAGALVLTLLPRLFAGFNTSQPPFVLFLLAGLAVIALTVVLFAAMGAIWVWASTRARWCWQRATTCS